MDKEKALELNYGDYVDADQVLNEEDIENLRSILSHFAEGFSFEELAQHERKIKKQMTMDRLRKIGKEFDSDLIELGDCSISKELKGISEKDDDLESEPSEAMSMYTTDLFDKKTLSAYQKRRNGFLGRKVWGQFYDMRLNDYSNYGYSDYKVQVDLDFLNNVKRFLATDEREDDTQTDGRKFESFFPTGMVLNGWLGGGSRGGIEVSGVLKHTLEYDDYINYVDYYCNLSIDGLKIPVAFDATTNHDEETFLVKLDRTSTDSVGLEKLPFGFGQIKYCSLNSEVGPRRMPLFKIALEYGKDFRMTDLAGGFTKGDAVRSAELLRSVGNDKIFSWEDFERTTERINAKDRTEEDEANERRLNIVANSFYNLRTSFFVLSEMYEQAGLILDKDQENRGKTISIRGELSDEEETNVRRIQGATWKALSRTMRRIVKMNGAEADYDEFDDKDLYEEFKALAGVYDRSEDKNRQHFLGMRFMKVGRTKKDRCYVEFMKAIEAEKNDVVYRYFEKKDIAGRELVKTRAGRFNAEMESSASPKETAREIFSKITFDSYLDNFEKLFETAKETDSVRIFLSRLGMGGFEIETGVLSGGYQESDEGMIKSERTTDATKLHDDFIERLFSDEDLRKKYLSGKNKNVVAGCFSNAYLGQEGNLKKLIGWGIGDGKLAEIIESVQVVSNADAEKLIAKLKRSSES